MSDVFLFFQILGLTDECGHECPGELISVVDGLTQPEIDLLLETLDSISYGGEPYRCNHVVYVEHDEDVRQNMPRYLSLRQEWRELQARIQSHPTPPYKEIWHWMAVKAAGVIDDIKRLRQCDVSSDTTRTPEIDLIDAIDAIRKPAEVLREDLFGQVDEVSGFDRTIDYQAIGRSALALDEALTDGAITQVSKLHDVPATHDFRQHVHELLTDLRSKLDPLLAAIARDDIGDWIWSYDGEFCGWPSEVRTNRDQLACAVGSLSKAVRDACYSGPFRSALIEQARRMKSPDRETWRLFYSAMPEIAAPVSQTQEAGGNLEQVTRDPDPSTDDQPLTPDPDVDSIPSGYPTPENYERDKWIYEQRKAGRTIPQIIDELANNKRRWGPLNADNSIREAEKRYANFHGLRVPKMKPGKPRTVR